MKNIFLFQLMFLILVIVVGSNCSPRVAKEEKIVKTKEYKIEYGFNTNAFECYKFQSWDEYLLTAIKFKDKEGIIEAIENGADSNLPENKKYWDKQLLLVKEKWDKEGIKEAIQCGANVNIRFDEDNSINSFLLGIAVSKKDEFLVKYLLEKGADVNNEYKEKGYYNSKSLLFNVIENNEQEIFKLFIDAGVNTSHSGLLSCAIDNHAYDIVHILIEKGADIKESDDYPLSGVIKWGSLDDVKFFIEKGADITKRCALFTAVKGQMETENNLELLNFLIEKGAPIEKTSQGVTPLALASYNGNIEVLNFLIDKGGTINGIEGNIGSPLLWAINNSKLIALEILVNKGADINEFNLWSLEEINHCRMNDILSLFLFGITRSDVIYYVEQVYEKGFKISPLLLASYEGKVEFVEYLIEKGAQLNIQDKDGRTPLMLANLTIFTDEYKRLLIVKRLVEAGADLTIQDNKGETALDYAGKNNNFKSVADYLWDKGARHGTPKAYKYYN